MDRTMISKDDEAQFLEMGLQERLEDDRSKLALLLERFESDLENHNVVWALNRVVERLAPYEAMLVALTVL